MALQRITGMSKMNPNKSGPSWTLVMIPDTQKLFYESCIDGEEVFRQMGQYISDQKTTKDIKMVMHIGDVVNNGGSSSQFADAQEGRDAIINSDIPYTYCPGNHDYAGDAHGSRDLTNFNSFFPLSSISGKSWYGGAYQAGASENIYVTQTIEGEKWLFLSVEFYPRTEVMTWMNSVIASEAPDFTVVATHAHVESYSPPYVNGEFWDAVHITSASTYGSNNYSSSFDTDGVELYNTVLSQNDSIVLVISGHTTDPRQQTTATPVGNNVGTVAHSGKQFTHANGTVCSEIVYNHQNDLIPGCETTAQQGTAGALHFFEINPSTRTITASGYDPVYRGDIGNLGNYPTNTPDWDARHNVSISY